MRLLNKLSTGAYRFNATPVEAVRVGVAHMKAACMTMHHVGGERLGWVTCIKTSLSTHLL